MVQYLLSQNKDLDQYFSNEIVIYFSSQLQAIDSVLKELRKLFSGLDESYVPTKTVGNIERPLFLLVPSKSKELEGLHDYKYHCYYGAGMYTFNPTTEKGVISALTFHANGDEEITPYVHLVEITNHADLFNYKDKKENFVSSTKLCHSSEFEKSNHNVVFSTDNELYVLHPTIKNLTASKDFCVTQFQKQNNNIKNDLNDRMNELEKKVAEVEDQENKILALELGISTMLKAIDDRFYLVDELTDQDLKDIGIVLRKQTLKEGKKYKRTVDILSKDLETLIKEKRQLMSIKRNVIKVITSLKNEFRKERRIQNLYESTEANDVAKRKFWDSLKGVEVSTRLEIENKTLVEAEFRAVAVFKFIPCSEAHHQVYTRFTGIKDTTKEGDIDVNESYEMD